MHKVEWTRAAQRSLYQLPLAVGQAIVEFVEGPLADNPRRVGRPLRAPYADEYGARRGDYRVRYRIDDDQVVVTVVRVGHRAGIYRPL